MKIFILKSSDFDVVDMFAIFYHTITLPIAPTHADMRFFWNQTFVCARGFLSLLTVSKAMERARGRKAGTVNTPLSARRKAVAEYKARDRGVTQATIAAKYNTSVATLKTWIAAVDASEARTAQFGGNTVYSGVSAPRPTREWLQSVVAASVAPPARRDVIAKLRELESEYATGASYPALFQIATRLIDSVAREELKYNSITRSIGVEKIPT